MNLKMFNKLLHPEAALGCVTPPGTTVGVKKLPIPAIALPILPAPVAKPAVLGEYASVLLVIVCP